LEVSRFESLALIGAVIGVAVLDSGAHSLGAGSSVVGNLAILLALFGFDGLARRSGGQSIAFAGVSGLCLLTPVLFVAKIVLGVAPPVETPWFALEAWLVATVLMFGVDRFRMSSKDDVSLAGAGLAGAVPVPIISTAKPTGYKPAAIRVDPVPAYTPAAPVPPPPTPPPPTVVPAPSFVAEPPAAAAAAPLADVTAIPPGREALIYLNLVGEGLNVLRTVRAENLGRDYYRIADVMPEGEQWEFTPGQVVKCRKKSLSNGKHMVAFEEAPRAQ
jgi:hypothetical protein